MNKQLYETPSSEAFAVSLEENFVDTNLPDPGGEKPTEEWDG